MTISEFGQSLGGPLPRWATPTCCRFFNEFMPLLCYAFYLYAKSIKASHHYAFKVKALKIYAFCDLCPASKVQYTVEPVTSTGLFPILGILKLSATLWSKIFCPTV